MTYTIGQLLDASWKSYKGNIKTYLLLSVILAFASGLTVIFRPVGVESVAEISPIYWVLLAINILVNFLIWLGIISFVYFTETDEDKTFFESIGHSLSRFFPFLFTSILLGVLLVGLTILLIIPAIIFGVYWAFVTQTVLFRKRSFFKALSYSKSLVNDNWWRTAGYFLLVSLLVSVIAGSVTFPLSLVSMFGAAHDMSIYMLAAINFVSVFVSSVVTIFAYVFQTGYFLALEDEKSE